MIPRAYIFEWQKNAPWKTNAQVEQDLVICRALIEIFSDEFLAAGLAFRGGTALHKLYLQPQVRYSEDIDLVQIRPEPIKDTIKRLQERLSFLGKASVDAKKNNNTLRFRFISEFPPVQSLKLKVETNCREHFSVFGYRQFPFEVKSSWFTGSCNITTYKLEELLGTKLRALYQRRKGRDLFDLYKAFIKVPDLKEDEIIKCYHQYMEFVVDKLPTQRQFVQNMDEKMMNDDFLGDIEGIIRPDDIYDQRIAYYLIRNKLIEKL